MGAIHWAMSLGAAIAVPSRSARAQETAPLVLRLPASPRVFGMGDSFIGGSGSDVVFYNPAAIGRQNGLFATVARYGKASTQAAVASSTSLGPLHLAFFGQWLDYGTGVFPGRPGALTVRGPNPSQSLAGGFALATAVKGFRIGAAAKYVEERGSSVRDGRAAFDVGLARQVGRFTVGLVAQHLGDDLDLGGQPVELPTRISLGATTRRFPIGTYFDFQATAAVARERGGTIAPSGGIEVTYEPVGGWTASARVGARRVDRTGSPALRPLTLGGSLGLDRVSLDYGLEIYRGSGTVHRFGIRIE